MKGRLVNHSNGKTKEVRRGCYISRTETQSECLGRVTGKSECDGFDQIISSRENWIRGNLPGGYVYDETTDIGKILQRLEQLESAYLKNLDDEKSRSEARLAETRLLREQFVSEVAELKEQIYQLATEENSVNGNGHIN